MDQNTTAALKAALLLSRVVCAHMAGEDFSLTKNEVWIDPTGSRICYEGEEFGVIALVSGSLMLLRGLVYDLAEIEDAEPLVISRVVALSAAMADAVGFPETAPRPQAEEN